MKALKAILVLLNFTSLQSVQAATFECTEVPAACKVKFGTQFEKDFKELHISSTRQLLNAYIDNSKAIRAELSADDPYEKPTQKSIDEVSKSLQKLNDNLYDNKKIREAMEQAIIDMSWNLKNIPASENFKNLIKKHNLRSSLLEIMRKLATDTGNLWVEMYSGLREKDLTTYPEYAEVNEHMENLRGYGTRRPSSKDYNMAAEILYTKFYLPYFEAISDIA